MTSLPNWSCTSCSAPNYLSCLLFCRSLSDIINTGGCLSKTNNQRGRDRKRTSNIDRGKNSGHCLEEIEMSSSMKYTKNGLFGSDGMKKFLIFLKIAWRDFPWMNFVGILILFMEIFSSSQIMRNWWKMSSGFCGFILLLYSKRKLQHDNNGAINWMLNVHCGYFFHTVHKLFHFALIEF